jgi:hypothetical protein
MNRFAQSDLLAIWDSNEGRPYKGRLIDWAAYEANPDNIGCMCAQGQALHLLGGYTPLAIRKLDQLSADREVARLFDISIAHAVLLRSVNDTIDGAPSIVLTHPEKVLGDQAHIVLAFWRHLDRMTEKDWDAAWNAARDVAWAAARDAARESARDAAWNAAWEAARDVAWAAAWSAARDAAWNAARNVAWAAARNVAAACSEIQGAKILREKGKPFFFLPLFGFADPEAVLAADALATS